MIVLLCRRTLTGWERVWQEPEKFSEGMYKVQSLGRNNPIYQDLLKKSFAEKALRVLVDTRFTKSQKWALTTKKTNSLPGWTRCCIASRLRETILPFCSALVRHTWCAGSSSGLTSTGETWTYWGESNEGLQKWLGLWSIWHIRRAGTVHLHPWRYSEPNRAQPRATCWSCPCFEQWR